MRYYNKYYRNRWWDEFKENKGMILFVLLILGLIVFFVYAELKQKEECYNDGGSWEIVDSYYAAPTYNRIGNSYIPSGGGIHYVYGCVYHDRKGGTFR